MIGYNKSVLEVGCSTGYFTKILVERGCSVVGIEIDGDAARVAEKWADRVIVGNIDEGVVWDEVKDESFDVVVLGDVLEHLRDPLGSLRQAVRKLKPSGLVVTSLPNIAHGDVRIALMHGTFRYTPTGLLDSTHMRFFTLESIRELLLQAGLVVVDTRRAIVPMFQTEIGVKRQDVSDAVLDDLLADPEVEVYQYVMQSVVDDGTHAVAGLSKRLEELSDHMHHEKVRAALLRKELHDDRLMAESVESQQRIIKEQQEYVGALEGHVSGLDHNIAVLHQSLAESDARYRSLLATRSFRLTAPLRWLSRKSAGTHGDAT
ncbi:MAG TPA: class I SAM-dependent methyltransferase [Acidimicrobiales bacterium]|jgi:SAM-dependent methyltransferase|nr:class I SAM-dependent methyltransferase [Acidimicrobiales bacterium]